MKASENWISFQIPNIHACYNRMGVFHAFGMRAHITLCKLDNRFANEHEDLAKFNLDLRKILYAAQVAWQEVCKNNIATFKLSAESKHDRSKDLECRELLQESDLWDTLMFVRNAILTWISRETDIPVKKLRYLMGNDQRRFHLTVRESDLTIHGHKDDLVSMRLMVCLDEPKSKISFKGYASVPDQHE